jgi:hypothetical protein
MCYLLYVHCFIGPCVRLFISVTQYLNNLKEELFALAQSMEFLVHHDGEGMVEQSSSQHGSQESRELECLC